MSISLKVQDKNGFTLAVARGEREVNLPYSAEYREKGTRSLWKRLNCRPFTGCPWMMQEGTPWFT